MPSLLITVFVVQLVIHLINTIGAATINNLLWQIYTNLPHGTSSAVKDQLKLQREVLRIKREMAATSSQDEFAKWARLRRQHDKAMGEYEAKASTVSSSRAKFDTSVTVTRWLGTNGLRLFLQFWYAKRPIFLVPEGWVPVYVEWLLAFPRAPWGSVSIQVWGAACVTVIGLVGELIGLVWRDVQARRVEGASRRREAVKMREKMGESVGVGKKDQ